VAYDLNPWFQVKTFNLLYGRKMDSITFEVTLKNRKGLHLRFAGIVAKAAQGFVSDIRVSKGASMADCKSPLALMSLGAPCGTKLVLTVEGPDAEEAGKKMTELFKDFQV